MKKIFAIIAATAISAVPMSSFALESMSKEALKKTTGQAGVSIFFDHIVIVIKSQPTVTYWDNDGVTSYGGTVGAVRAAGIQIESSGKKAAWKK